MSEREESLLVIKATRALRQEEWEHIRRMAAQAENATGMRAILADESIDVEVHQPLGHLVDAIRQQTEALNRLAQSNMMLINAMAEVEDLDMPAATYLDGTPVS